MYLLYKSEKNRTLWFRLTRIAQSLWVNWDKLLNLFHFGNYPVCITEGPGHTDIPVR